MDELAALTLHQKEYQDCCIMLFMETWLTTLTPDINAALDGFQVMWADRSKDGGKRVGSIC